MKPLIVLLCFLAGYLDTAGFVSLGGLFVAHVTGNFVTLGAALATHSGVTSKLLALPVFALVIALVKVSPLPHERFSALQWLFAIQTLLLALAGGIAFWLGEKIHPDSGLGLMLAMLLVSAMAIQNAVHRIYLTQLPPSTLMTGSTTQAIIDAIEVIKAGRALPLNLADNNEPSQTRQRLARLIIAIGAFACGCAVAALIHQLAGSGVFILPPFLAMLSLGYIRAQQRAKEES